jgi:subtilisin-like proprotein convertase family protein
MKLARFALTLVALALLVPATAAHAVSPPAPPNCAGLTTTTPSASGLPLAIPDNGVVTSSISIAPTTNTIYDVDVSTSITHNNSADLDITLTSPAGYVVTLTTDNGSTFNDIFNGTTWDDDANPGSPAPYPSNNGLVTDHSYVASGVVSPLAPEEGLGALIGQPVSGAWTLTISDDTANAIGGSLNAWSLTINSSPTPMRAVTQFSQALQSGSQAISASGTPTVTSTVAVSGAAPYTTLVQPSGSIAHTRSSDLDVTLTSPAGTDVTLTTDNGSSFDDVFAPVTWQDGTNELGQVPYLNNDGMTTDRLYSDGGAASLTPEEPLSAFIGENPNGTWTLTVSDDTSGEGGTLQPWALTILPTTCTDLATTLTVSRDPVAVGEPLVYNMTSTNRANVALSNGSVSLPLPAGMNFTSLTAPAGWTCSTPPAGSNGTVSCTRASVPAGSTNTFSVEAAPTTAAIGVISTTGQGVVAPADVLTQNDTASVSSTVIAPPATPANPGPMPNCGAPPLTTATATDDVAIPSSGTPTVSSTLNVSGAQPYLTDLDLFTKIPHTFAGDLEVTLTSPAGTVVTLTTDNGSSTNDVFNGTTWDDDANPGSPVPYTANPGLVTDRQYGNLVVAERITPEEPLAAFIGEDPNGTWTLTVSDDAGGDGGTIDEWTLNLSGLPAAPPETSGSATNGADVPVSTLAAQTSTIEVSGAGTYLTDVDAITKLAHTSSGQIDMALRSPQGTEVTLTTDNGGGSDNVFNGTTWNDDANPGGQVPYPNNNGLASDTTYANNVVVPALAPEEGLGAFIGENPNGTWTLLISDDVPASSAGTLDEWTLNFKTGACAPPSTPTPPPPGGNPPVAKAAALSKLKLSPTTFRAATRGASVAAKKKPKKPPVGTKVSYRLDKAAKLTFSVLRVTTGRRSGKKCVAQTKKNRKAKKCTRLVGVKGSFTHNGKTGANTLKFSGRVGGKRLGAGSYRLRAVATVGTLKSKTLEAAFKVVSK